MTKGLKIKIKGKEFFLLTDTVFCLSKPEDGITLSEAILTEARNHKRALPEVVGFVGEGFPLLANLSILENALLPVLWHGIMSKDRAMERFMYLAEKLGLWDLRHARKDALTEEELFRAGLLRAMMAGPEWLYIDFETSERMALNFTRWFRDLFPEERPKILISVVSPSMCPEGFQEVKLHA